MWLFISLALGQEPVLEAKSLIEQTFEENISTEEIDRAAINGMLTTIEKKTGLSGSVALSFQEHQELLSRQLGIREGYGLRVQLLPGRGFFVESVINDGPAAIAGIEKGDVIISLGDNPFTGLEPEQMLAILNQQYNEKIPIDVIRNNELRRFHLTKGLFQLQLVSIDKSINIHFFGKGASEQLHQYLKGASQKGVVIDLRDTDGGGWEEAIRALDLLLPKEEIIGYRKTMDGVAIPIISKEEAIYNGPIILLINQGTSGPAELFALTLQEYERAIIMGNQSAGNASDFRIHSLGDDIILKLVNTEILSSLKRSWTGKGIEPDMLIRQNIALPSYGSSSTDIQLETALRLLSSQ
jgi:carboxyl-terminal processing protease